MQALESVWVKLGIKRTSEWGAMGGFVGVGVEGGKEESPLWSDELLGLAEAEGVMEGVVEQRIAAAGAA